MNLRFTKGLVRFPAKQAALAVCFAGAISFLPMPAHCADSLPAVSEFNGKLSYEGGDLDSFTGNNIDGSFSFPVTHSFGGQADVLYSRIGNMNFYGGGGHFFWRDPDIGLIGLTGGYLSRIGVNTYNVGAEGEWYVSRFTIGFFGGLGNIHYDNPAPFISTDPTRLLARLSADYYPIDDLRVGVSYTTAYQLSLYKISAEYQTPLRGLALTAEGSRGDYGYNEWLLGVRYYFGSNKKLIERHRQDDPSGITEQMLQTLGLYGSKFTRLAEQFIEAHPNSGAPSDGFGLINVINLDPISSLPIAEPIQGVINPIANLQP